MALSDDEQRALDQMEADLAADGPTFVGPEVEALRRSPRYRVDRRRIGLGVLGLLAGLALVVAGVPLFFGISIVGYLLMLVAALSLRGSVVPLDPPATRPSHPRLAQQDFVQLMERQWGLRHSDDR